MQATRSIPKTKYPDTGAALKRALQLLPGHRQLAILAYASLFLSTAAQLMVPQLVQNIIDAVSSSFAAQYIHSLPAANRTQALQQAGWTVEQLTHHLDGGRSAILWAGALIILFAILRGLFSFSQSFHAEKISQEIAYDLRNDIYSKMQRLSFSYHDRHQTGQLMIRATDDVEKVRLFLGQGLMIAAQAILLLTGSLAILMLTNMKLALVILPLLPLAVLVFQFFGRLIQPLFNEVQIRLSTLNTVLQENLAGIRVVKAFVREPQQQDRFEQAAESFMRQHIRVIRIMSFLTPVVFLLANLGQAVVLYFGGRQIIAGSLSLGQWQKFSLYLVYVFYPLSQLGMIISQMSQAGASATRVFEILDTRDGLSSKTGAIELHQVAGRVTFEHVTFRYLSESRPVLEDVSFIVEPGETIALLGATGSGKSSIINLIPRFYDASQGSVCIDGHDVRDVELDSLRRNIGIVLQDSTLFSGTIRDNIAFGKPAASMEDIMAAAKSACAHEFIMGFPDAYDTPVGERGTTLSGGQKQRIAIARALLMNARILILDDSTSSVDSLTEQQMQQSLFELMEGRTSFVIAQRISTVRNANRILVLDRGRVAAQGEHKTLLEESPLYAEIYHSQLFDDDDTEDNYIRNKEGAIQ